MLSEYDRLGDPIVFTSDNLNIANKGPVDSIK